MLDDAPYFNISKSNVLTLFSLQIIIKNYKKVYEMFYEIIFFLICKNVYK